MSNELNVQNNVASEYAFKRYQGIGLKYHSKIIEEMMDGIEGKILDLGCGIGLVSEIYPKLDILGIDISPGMLAHHKGKHKLASACDIPFPNNHFDSVICRSVLHHIPNCEKALSEINRVLKPGGRFVCWETNKSWLATIIRKFTQHGDHFSEYHTSFDNLPELIGKFFNIKMVKYQGFLGYAFYGFPDILSLHYVFGCIYGLVMACDEILSRIPLVNRMSFAIMIKGTK